MKTVVGIRFRVGGKIYYFDPDRDLLKNGEYCIVETSRGKECGKVVMGNREVEDTEVTLPLKTVLRRATPEDIRRMEENRGRENKARKTCNEYIRKLGLEMSLVDVECNFERSKILFYFTADGRVDFRELVKQLASSLHTRIELRQIGVRDESKMMGGLGICGRPFCCASFLGDFHPVTIRMAKEQGMSLNPVKISGTCGRLMCCLGYEQKTYEHYWKQTPRNGTLVKTPEGTGTVVDVNVLQGQLKVKFVNGEDISFKMYAVDDVVPLRSSKPEKPKKAEKAEKVEKA